MYESELKLAQRTARKAGKFLSEVSLYRVDSAIGKDVKLSTDKESEKIIVESLEGTGYSILSEEMGFIDKGTDEVWIIDPLDGTANYWRGMRELCCVSIALWKKKSPIFGVIYRFELDEMYVGIVGEGAWLNDLRIHTSNVQSISEAFLVTGFPVRSDFSPEGLSRIIAPVAAFKKVRMLGAAAIMGSLVACGRADVYMEDRIMLWDIAGSTAIVNAAGGCVNVEICDDCTCNCRLFANKELMRSYDAEVL